MELCEWIPWIFSCAFSELQRAKYWNFCLDVYHLSDDTFLFFFPVLWDCCIFAALDSVTGINRRNAQISSGTWMQTCQEVLNSVKQWQQLCGSRVVDLNCAYLDIPSGYFTYSYGKWYIYMMIYLFFPMEVLPKGKPLSPASWIRLIALISHPKMIKSRTSCCPWFKDILT